MKIRSCRSCGEFFDGFVVGVVVGLFGGVTRSCSGCSVVVVVVFVVFVP